VHSQGKGWIIFLSPLRIENEFNLSKEKGKMLQTDGEMDSLYWQKNSMLVPKINEYFESI